MVLMAPALCAFHARCYASFNTTGGAPVPFVPFIRLRLFLIVLTFLLPIPALHAQDKKVSSGTLKIGFLMDSLKIERWHTDLDNFQKRAKELGAAVLVETAEGDDELQLQQAQKLLDAGVKSLVLVSHDADKSVRIVNAAKARKVPLLCYERLVHNEDVSFFVGVDASAIGFLQANSLTQHAPKGNYVLSGRSRSQFAWRVTADYFSPQNVASGLTNSKPASHASWLRQTTSASAFRPVSG
jgi:ABC-type sugar transport system substrate-binding protein